MTSGPQLDSTRCEGCGLCVSVCTQNGLVLAGGIVVFVGGEECTWCGECEAVCLYGAISCPYDIVIEA